MTSNDRIRSLTDQFRIALIESSTSETALKQKLQDHTSLFFSLTGMENDTILDIDLVGNMNSFNSNSSMRYGGCVESPSMCEPKERWISQASTRWCYYPHYKPAKNPSFHRLSRIYAENVPFSGVANNI